LDTRDPLQFTDELTKKKKLLQMSCRYETIRQYFCPNKIPVPNSGPFALLHMKAFAQQMCCSSADFTTPFNRITDVEADMHREDIRGGVALRANEIMMNATDLKSLNVTAEKLEPAITLSSLQHKSILEQLGVSICQEENEKLYTHFNLVSEKMIWIEQTPLLKAAQINVFFMEIICPDEKRPIDSRIPTPTDAQPLASLFLLNPRSDRGRLLQVDTGEEKTATIAMFAVAKYLEGYKVDILTTSVELSFPQSEEQRPLFELFGLTRAHNSQDNWDSDNCYTADIVYGSVDDFQCHILHQDFSSRSRRGKRTHVIVDEWANEDLILERKLKTLEESIPAKDDHTEHAEIMDELEKSGTLGTFTIMNKNQIRWKSVMALAAIRLRQIATGAALTVFTMGVGSTIGMGLITEG
uniref:Chloroplast protein-transporting ATPase n=1 Tax=Echinostoma caproni TaxID=27848 RepID=A0A183A0F8_9TREM